MIQLIPAIDLRGGNCVRLWQGSYERETIYDNDPVEMARSWRAQNAGFLHVVDLDAARWASGADNRCAIGRICTALDIPVQVGGGIRSLDDIKAMLNLGASRVILGTVAARKPDLVSEAIDQFSPEQVVVGIDARDGIVCVEGWTESSGIDALDLAAHMEDRGVRRIVYTDISRDGTMEGPNIEAYKNLSRRLRHVRITASGGVGDFRHLAALNTLQSSGVDSVIVGRSLYETKFPCQRIWKWSTPE